jgi:hypothetical protein
MGFIIDEGLGFFDAGGVEQGRAKQSRAERGASRRALIGRGRGQMTLSGG